MNISIKNIAIIGQPNSGKSTLFNVLSDKKISTSNFAGTTVKINECEINYFGEIFRIIDLPGTYSLNPTDGAEQVTLDYLLNQKIDLIINVVDANLLSRSIELTAELIEFGIPIVVALNMLDESERHGIFIDSGKLESKIKLPIVETMGLYGKGVKKLIEKCYNTLNNSNYKLEPIAYTHHVEETVSKFIELFKSSKNAPISHLRFYAIKAIENPSLLPKELQDEFSYSIKSSLNSIYAMHKRDGFDTISQERHHIAMKISEEVSELKSRKTKPLIEKFDNYLLHPIIGLGFLAIFFVLYFTAIFYIGDLLSSIMEIPFSYIDPYINSIKSYNEFLWFTVNGFYQGIVGMLGIVLPYFLPLVFLTSIFEDTGYLARIAFLIDGIMHKIGLQGKSVIAFILGFGCSIPAIYATRIMENPRDRLATGILIPFIPCSARISVIFALSVAFTGPYWAIFVFFYVLFIIAIAGKFITNLLPIPTGLILEIPRLKIPSLKISFQKTNQKIRELLSQAFLFLLLGSVVFSWIEYFNISTYVNTLFAPIIKYVLGLPEQLGSTLVFGFLRKELILVMSTQAMGVDEISKLPLTISQAVVFVIFLTLYFPCITTLVVTIKEFGKKAGLYSALLSITLATISAFIFKLILNI